MTQETQRKFILYLHQKYKIHYKTIAEDIGISKSYLSMWLNNQRKFATSKYYKMLDYCTQMQNQFGIERDDYM